MATGRKYARNLYLWEIFCADNEISEYFRQKISNTKEILETTSFMVKEKFSLIRELIIKDSFSKER